MSKYAVPQKLSLRAIGLIGALIFASFFLFTYTIPDWVEEYAAEFIESEVSKRIDTTIDGLSLPKGQSALAKLAESIIEKNEAKITPLRSALKARVHEEMATALASIRDLDCECREQWATFFKEGMQFEMDLLQKANDKLVDFIHSEYTEVVAKLKNDIRIFTAANAFMFLILLFVSFMNPRAIGHLFLPGVLLFVSTIICTYFYLFKQNWLMTIIYSDYVGYAYLGYLALVFGFLCDIIFNHGRITTEIINGFFHAIGSALSVVPC